MSNIQDTLNDYVKALEETKLKLENCPPEVQY